VQTLEKLHKCSDIHGSINPDIICINPETFEVDIMKATSPASFACFHAPFGKNPGLYRAPRYTIFSINSL